MLNQKKLGSSAWRAVTVHKQNNNKEKEAHLKTTTISKIWNYD